MTYKDVLSLGWKHQDHLRLVKDDPTQTFFYPADPQHDHYIMSVSFVKKEKRHTVMIKLVPHDCKFNEWENSETEFYGRIETKEDLALLMKFLDVKDEQE